MDVYDACGGNEVLDKDTDRKFKCPACGSTLAIAVHCIAFDYSYDWMDPKDIPATDKSFKTRETELNELIWRCGIRAQMLAKERGKGKFTEAELDQMDAELETRKANAEKELAIVKAASWGWTSYRKTDLINDSGVSLYEANFSNFYGVYGYETCKVYFYANKPTAALRAICESGKHPLEFDDKVLD